MIYVYKKVKLSIQNLAGNIVQIYKNINFCHKMIKLLKIWNI